MVIGSMHCVHRVLVIVAIINNIIIIVIIIITILLMAIQNVLLIYVRLVIFHFLVFFWRGGAGEVISINLVYKGRPPQKISNEEEGSPASPAPLPTP